MDKILKYKNSRPAKLLTAVIMLMMVWIALAPSAAYAGSVSAGPMAITVEAKQIFVTSSKTADNTFTYRLKKLVDDSPMPSGSTAEGYTFTISGNKSFSIGPVPSEPGRYRYELSQVVQTAKPGYTYDKRVYTIEVYVNGNTGVQIVVKKPDGSKTNNIVFENTYDAAATDPSLMVDPPIKKTVSGNPETKGVFTFKLEARDHSWPMPSGSKNGIKMLTINGPGEDDFGVWSYTKAGVYNYTVSEVNNGENGYTYDTAVYTITDTVTDVNAQLVLDRVVTNKLNKPVTSYAFINEYNDGKGEDGGGDGKGVLGPKTGDDMNTGYYMALLIIGGGTMSLAIMYLILGGKRKKGRETA